jgi:glycosyltransferase involved in cell wall biosynthesis
VSAFPFSLITTFYNESNTVKAVLDSLALGSRIPDETIVVDGGSTDSTVNVIESWSKRHAEMPLRVIQSKGRINIAAGRNMAIRAASFEHIAVIDGGCIAHRDWLRNLMSPFSVPDPPQVVAGWYEPLIRSRFHARVAQALIPRLSEVRAESFLPSSRSIAFTRSAWASVGGYPELLRFAGEDTLFDLRLKQAGCRFVFAPEAVVNWEPRENLRALLTQYYRYGYGDGEARIMTGSYLYRLAACLVPPLVAATGKGWANFGLRYSVYLATTYGWLAGLCRCVRCK